MPGNRRRGFQAERELVKKLWNHGFAVIRAPASGSGARRIFYPDIVAIYRGKVFVIEVKYRSSNGPIYISRDKMDKLLDFAKRANAQIFVAIKIKSRGWYLAPLMDACITTPQGCKIEIINNNIISLEDFINKAINDSLDKYISNNT